MKDIKAREIKLNDRVRWDSDLEGIVVCNIEGKEFTQDFPADAWDYLEKGIMVESPQVGLVHLSAENSSTSNLEVVR